MENPRADCGDSAPNTMVVIAFASNSDRQQRRECEQKLYIQIFADKRLDIPTRSMFLHKPAGSDPRSVLQKPRSGLAAAPERPL